MGFVQHRFRIRTVGDHLALVDRDELIWIKFLQFLVRRGPSHIPRLLTLFLRGLRREGLVTLQHALVGLFVIPGIVVHGPSSKAEASAILPLGSPQAEDQRLQTTLIESRRPAR